MVHKNVLHLVLENKSARNPGSHALAHFPLFVCCAMHGMLHGDAVLSFTSGPRLNDAQSGWLAALLAFGPFVSLKKQRGSSSGTSWACLGCV